MSKNIGIDAESFRKILNLFKKHPQIKTVVLFGSRAKDNFREGSDIDLALKGKDLDTRLLTEIEMDYEALYLPWKLDLVIYDKIENQELKDHIDRIGILV